MTDRSAGRCVLSVPGIFGVTSPALNWVGGVPRSFTLKKLECLKQAVSALNTLAWDNGIRSGSRLGLGYQAMINGDGGGSSYLPARGEILGPGKDELLRKH